MTNASHRAATALSLLAIILPIAAFAAAKPFVGPTGWEHLVGAMPTAQVPRAQETWKKSDGELLVYLSDGGLSYDDIVGAVKKNIADNSIRTAMDADRTCAGKRAHEVEMTFSPTVVHQLIVDDAPGVTKLTYSRPDAIKPSDDAKTAIAAFCGT